LYVLDIGVSLLSAELGLAIYALLVLFYLEILSKPPSLGKSRIWLKS
jgi:hypothetical protein